MVSTFDASFSSWIMSHLLDSSYLESVSLFLLDDPLLMDLSLFFFFPRLKNSFKSFCHSLMKLFFFSFWSEAMLTFCAESDELNCLEFLRLAGNEGGTIFKGDSGSSVLFISLDTSIGEMSLNSSSGPNGFLSSLVMSISKPITSSFRWSFASILASTSWLSSDWDPVALFEVS